MTEINSIDDPYFGKILEKIKEERNLDFLEYRKKILSRRIMARVNLTKSGNFMNYFSYLNSHPSETDKLLNTLTINVTEFFRDSAVFDVLEKKIIPEMVLSKNHLNQKTVRIWSCGCASGEETYSVLILLIDFLGRNIEKYNINVLGTDIDKEALAQAKGGVFSEEQFKKMPLANKKLIDKYFFHKKDNLYQMKEDFQPLIDFQYHDVISDPPPLNIDMILCRNVFIYFDRTLQNKILKRFSVSLNKGGFLVIGTSESILTENRDLFDEYDRKARIFVRKGT